MHPSSSQSHHCALGDPQDGSRHFSAFAQQNAAEARRSRSSRPRPRPSLGQVALQHPRPLAERSETQPPLPDSALLIGDRAGALSCSRSSRQALAWTSNMCFCNMASAASRGSSCGDLLLATTKPRLRQRLQLHRIGGQAERPHKSWS